MKKVILVIFLFLLILGCTIERPAEKLSPEEQVLEEGLDELEELDSLEEDTADLQLDNLLID